MTNQLSCVTEMEASMHFCLFNSYYGRVRFGWKELWFCQEEVRTLVIFFLILS